MSLMCKICGRPESDHHEYVPRIILPPGCVCDPKTWLRAVPPVCDRFKPYPANAGRCVNCEHDKACHPNPETHRWKCQCGAWTCPLGLIRFPLPTKSE